MTIKFSILVVVKSDKYLDTLVKSISKLDYDFRMLEVLFLDNFCDCTVKQKLAQLEKKYSFLKVIETDHNLSIPQARNKIVSIARGEYILFTDHDVELEPQWIHKVEETINQGFDLVGGRMDSKQKNILARFENTRKQIWYDKVYREKIAHFETANIAIKRDIFKSVQFDKKIPFAEDLKFTIDVIKKNYRVKFNKDIFVYHNHREKLIPYLTTFFKYGTSHARVQRKDNTMGFLKKLKILWFSAFIPLFMISIYFTKAHALMLLLPFAWNKYTIPFLKQAREQGIKILLYFLLEPLRFEFWSLGFVWGYLKSE